MTFAISILAIIFIHIAWQLYSIKRLLEIKFDDQNDWLFKSLYSINHNVKLPKKEVNIKQSKPAKIIKIGDNGMDEFSGDRDDFH